MTKIKSLTIKQIILGLYNRISVFIEGVGELFVNLYYGNSAGLKYNWGALKELEELRSQPLNMVFEPETKNYAAALEEEGYILLGRISSDEIVADVVKKVKTVFDSESAESMYSSNGATQFIKMPLTTVPIVSRLLDDKICKIISCYYKTALRVETIRIWRNHHVSGRDNNKEDVYSNTFHHDNCKVTGLRVFILLKDGVNRHNGAFRFHDRKTSRRFIRSLGYFHRFMQTPRMLRKLTNENRLKYFEGDSGDVAIVNTQQCLHAASIPQSPGDYRDILQFEIYPAKGDYKSNLTLTSELPEDQEVQRMIKESYKRQNGNTK